MNSGNSSVSIVFRVYELWFKADIKINSTEKTSILVPFYRETCFRNRALKQRKRWKQDRSLEWVGTPVLTDHEVILHCRIGENIPKHY